MYHQFMELAGVDITAVPMEVGPTLHYMMGGVRVDAETQAATVPGLFAIGEVSGGMHGANRLGGNSLSDLIVFGRRAGIGAADFAEDRVGTPSVDPAEVASVIDEAFAPFGREDGYNPYDVHEELQETMQTLVGIIRTGPELEEALAKLEDLKQQTAKVQVKGGRAYNPGWNLATDLPSMITTSIAVAQGALNRKESRGGHTREDYPGPDPEMGKVNFVQRQTADHGYLAPIAIAPEPLPEMPPELRALFEEAQ
jgi:succinate dehydrogenase / fumarate reductase flavoprotein subunit